VGRRIPTVSLTNNWLEEGVAVVCPDDEAIGRMAAEHLLSLGLRSFACYGYPIPGYSLNRQEVFERYLAGQGFRCDRFRWPINPPELVHEDRPDPHLMAWVQSLPKPVGLFAVTDQLGWELTEVCHLAGLPIPDQVAVIGVDNDEMLCELAWPPLTSVIVNSMRIGYEAAALLDRMMSGDPPPAKPVLIAPLGVAARQSTNLLAVEDVGVAKALHFIRSHLGDNISVRDVVKASAVSRRSLERRFKEILRRSIRQEIHRARIEEACRLLATTHRKVQQISEILGFSYPQRFYLAFRKATGVSPAQWRRKMQFRLSSPASFSRRVHRRKRRS
jgi:LacI family transcriptional regulator